MEVKQSNTPTLAMNWNQGAKGFQTKKNPRRHRHAFFLNDKEQGYLDELFDEGYKKAEMIAEMIELHRQHRKRGTIHDLF